MDLLNEKVEIAERFEASAQAKHIGRRNRKFKRKQLFNPSRSELDPIVQDYLDSGGKITRIETTFR